jgi:crossover junction endodeoxyribonuclease RusA
VICIDVLGLPAPQGSKRHVGRGILVESSTKVGPWREAVVAAATNQGHANLMLEGPVSVDVSFYFPRPKGHYRADGSLRDSAPFTHSTKPDIDKVLRSTLDALVQAAVIADDSRVQEVEVRKLYATSDRAPGALIFVDGAAA